MKRFLPLLAVPAFLLAGCSAGTGTTASPTAGATSATAPATNDSTATAGAPATSSSTSVSGQGAAGPPRCHSGDLSLKFGQGDAAAGTYHENLVFTNKSGHKCTLYGYPGVSWVTGNNGTQVNEAFQRSPGAKKTITLAAGGRAHAVVITHNALNYPTDKCKPVATRGYRIYPPDETAAIFVSQAEKQCSIKGVNLGQVLPIESGAGERGE
jgi:Protein of unknown function (DUF4232)